jgi:hypothetical protein
MSSTLDRIRRWSGTPIGIQLNHAGRKASTEVPWVGGAQIASSAPNGWQTKAPSSIPYAEGQMSPQMLDRDGLRDTRDAFVSSAKRARRIGLDLMRTATSCTNSYHRLPINVTIRMANPWRIARVFRLRYSRLFGRRSPTGLSPYAYPAPTRWREAGTSNKPAPSPRCSKLPAATPSIFQAAVSIPLSGFPWGQAIRCHWLGPSKQPSEFPSLPSD